MTSIGLISLIKNAPCGSKDDYFSYFHSSCQLGLNSSFFLIIFFCSDLMNYLESVEDREGDGDGGPPAANGALPILNRSPLNSK